MKKTRSWGEQKRTGHEQKGKKRTALGYRAIQDDNGTLLTGTARKKEKEAGKNHPGTEDPQITKRGQK